MDEDQKLVESESKKIKEFKTPQYLIDAKRNSIYDYCMLYCGTKSPQTQSLLCFALEYCRPFIQFEVLNVLLYL